MARLATVRHKLDQLTIGELAERSGGAVGAALLRGPGPDHGRPGHRATSGATSAPTLRRVAFIRSAQRVGLSLEEITEALGTLPGGRTPTKADWTRLSRAVAGPDQRPDRPAGAAAGPAGQLHRVRLPEPAAVQPVEP